jgi:hypothetical protein
MSLLQRGAAVAGEPRSDTGVLSKVAALATRLQSRQQETLTVPEMEEIGAEVGLDPAFMRQAMVELMAESHPPEAARIDMKAARKAEFWSVVGALGFSLFWGLLASLAPVAYDLRVPSEYHAHFFATSAFVAGFLTALASTPAINQAFNSMFSPSPFSLFAPTFYWGLLMIPLASLLGWQGARLRAHYFPLASSKLPVSRLELLDVPFALQSRLEGQKQRRAFLSADVVGSAEMKRGGSELTVEYSFGRYQEWVEGVIRRNAGAMQIATGDGVMGVFPTDAGARRASFRGGAGFSAEQNRLSTPFRLPAA